MQVFVEREETSTYVRCVCFFEGKDVRRRVNCVEATVKPSASQIATARERSWHVGSG